MITRSVPKDPVGSDLQIYLYTSMDAYQAEDLQPIKRFVEIESVESEMEARCGNRTVIKGVVCGSGRRRADVEMGGISVTSIVERGSGILTSLFCKGAVAGMTFVRPGLQLALDRGTIRPYYVNQGTTS